MEEIKEGDYIRTDNGEIAKVIYNATNEFCYKEMLALDRVVSVNNSEFIYRDDIVKHSKNIIDLIEAGDYVNGCKVIDICESQYGGEKIIYIGGFGIPKKIYDNQIKSILTKEQYEQNSYKL